ncbi:hypothetical protein SARC_02801 [Sphaeroforma arctica JP610]|uniref:Uncharacterized protein n=1 Tax=Sphaeroforma arctica JP610 TaxID=667725 RepID=A0A0L0G9S7_9EUKA|nr:hypothetical protein SARC_02801 [Sphaeroforma arctica JP610]KNC85013.1 hypothetical protein SARC_02801 [Sphaeroforma arctica JP610]|eukprot:XP_014158915.1 hypothetical protein SARC_02801 [Sphaeroforma arctica JP610]
MVVNEVLNLVLKKSIKEARPVFDDYPAHIGVYGKHGMPSNHTQFTAYFANFVVLCLWKRYISRVRGGGLSKIYETYKCIRAQVVVGGLTGAGFAEIWFYLGNEVLRDALKATVQFPIAKWLYLKDTSDVDNVLLFEYQCYAKESERVQENETSDENRRKTD